jgi:membrane fusion protein (multidrug efflux system)/multidrug resistance protein K
MLFRMEELRCAEIAFGKVRPQRKNKKRMIYVALIIIPYFIFCIWSSFSYHRVPETSDAYITGNPVFISSEISGRVALVTPTLSDRVRKGDILLHMDNTREALHVKKAERALLETGKEVKERYIADSQNNTHILTAQMAYQQALNDYNRRLQSIGPRAISEEDLRQALGSVNNSKAALDTAIQLYRRNLLSLRDADIARQKLIIQAREALQKAAEALDRTAIRSPVTGYVAQRNVHAGLTVSPGQKLMAVVPADRMWINANFTATQLLGVSIGQKASIVTEMYGNNVIFDGQVEGWDRDTSPALLALSSKRKPIGEMQKIAVRISINPMQMSQYPLRIGVSSKVRLLNGHARSALMTMLRKGINTLRAYRRQTVRDQRKDPRTAGRVEARKMLH